MEDIPLPLDHPCIPLPIRAAASKRLLEIGSPDRGVIFRVETDEGTEWWLFVDDELEDAFWLEQ